MKTISGGKIKNRESPQTSLLSLRSAATPTLLRDNAEVIIIGGGPAGSFFAMCLLRAARQQGKKLSVSIIEKKQEPNFYEAEPGAFCREGCNYCAGGISPRLMDLLEKEGLILPEAICQGKVKSLTIQGHWKNIELEVPQGRKMTCVFRGSRPKMRPHRYSNFDGYLLQKAAQLGAEVITGEVSEVKLSKSGLPLVTYNGFLDGRLQAVNREADFVAVAGGVKQAAGIDLKTSSFYRSLSQLIPGFVPPRVRKTLIFELEGNEEFLRTAQGEIHFVEYGSHRLQIEMSSIMPKGKFVTVVLIGPSIDRCLPSQHLEIISRYLELPHIRKILPAEAQLRTVCGCSPNMPVGAARNPFADRIAVIGDLAVSRLYKDGIFSAYLTASGLANSIIYAGIDKRSLRKSYWPVIHDLKKDNRFGALVFMLNRVAFGHPVLSRILYQAVISERKKKDKERRRLAKILWKIASGDDSYRNVFGLMLHPASTMAIFTGGVLVTLRNYLTELLFGLRWEGFGRYPTGVPKEQFLDKKQELIDGLRLRGLSRSPEYERLYSIKIRGDRKSIVDQLGKFGDGDRKYFKPRILQVNRVKGRPNEIGSVINYKMPFGIFSFRIVLESIVDEEYILYRVQNGFARGGVLVFEIEGTAEGTFLLTIYVSFDFVRGNSLPEKLFRSAFRFLFPGFVHDVLWNHSLCELRDIVETTRRMRAYGRPREEGVSDIHGLRDSH